MRDTLRFYEGTPSHVVKAAERARLMESTMKDIHELLGTGPEFDIAWARRRSAIALSS